MHTIWEITVNGKRGALVHAVGTCSAWKAFSLYIPMVCFLSVLWSLLNITFSNMSSWIIPSTATTFFPLVLFFFSPTSYDYLAILYLLVMAISAIYCLSI